MRHYICGGQLKTTDLVYKVDHHWWLQVIIPTDGGAALHLGIIIEEW